MRSLAHARAAVVAVVLVAAAAALSACNTTKGIGEDLSAAGHAITGSAEKNSQ